MEVCGVLQMNKKRQFNEHFQAAMRIAENLPAMLTREAKRVQQKAILRELAAGLRTGSK